MGSSDGTSFCGKSFVCANGITSDGYSWVDIIQTNEGACYKLDAHAGNGGPAEAGIVVRPGYNFLTWKRLRFDWTSVVVTRLVFSLVPPSPARGKSDC